LAKLEAQRFHQNWSETMRSCQAALVETANEIRQSPRLVEAEFSEAAERLVDRYGFQAVEWNSRVNAEDREALERELSNRTGQRIKIQVKSPNGQEHLPNHNRYLYPAQFVYPPDLESEILGIHRQGLTAYRVANTSDDVAWTSMRQLYDTLQPSIAVCFAVRSLEDTRPRGYLLATLPRSLFDVGQLDSARRTIARILKVPDDERFTVIQSHEFMKFEPELLTRVWVGDTPFENVRYRLEFAHNPLFQSKLYLLPWFGLLVGPLWFSCRYLVKSRSEVRRNAVENDKLRKDLSDLQREQTTLKNLLQFREQERSMIANEIHDGFVQEAFGAQMFLEAVAARVGDDIDATTKAKLDSARDLLQRCMVEARQLVDSLQPSILDQLGFLPAIESLLHDAEERYGISIALRHKPQFPEIDINTQRALYRMIQESLSNIRRHSGASEATIDIDHDAEWIYLEVHDRGRGFSQEVTDDSGFGLRGIRDRAGMLNGTAKIQSAPGKGTDIAIRVPYHPGQTE
jgi:signal transduction histidine kinase